MCKHCFFAFVLAAAVLAPSLGFASYAETQQRAEEYYQSAAYLQQQREAEEAQRARWLEQDARAVKVFASRFHGGLASFDFSAKEFSTVDGNDCKYIIASGGWGFQCIDRVTFATHVDVDSEEYLFGRSGQAKRHVKKVGRRR